MSGFWAVLFNQVLVLCLQYFVESASLCCTCWRLLNIMLARSRFGAQALNNAEVCLYGQQACPFSSVHLIA